MIPHLPIKYGFDSTASPPPVPSPHQGEFVPSFDDRLWLFRRKWEPPLDENVKATLMIAHGTVDHSGVYEELARKLSATGIAVFAQDMRGWGLSDGESMYFHDLDTFCQDLHTMHQQIHEMPRYQNVKHRFLLGKSIGGTITAHCIAKYPENWTGLIGLSGAYDSDMIPPLPVVYALGAAALVAPKLPIKHLFDEHLIVADADALQAWRDDPLCSKDKVRLGYIVQAIRHCQSLQDIEFPNTLQSMLMMVGSDDKVVTNSGHELMISKCGDRVEKSLKLYDQGRHNLLHEPSLKDKVMHDIEDWILLACAKN